MVQIRPASERDGGASVHCHHTGGDEDEHGIDDHSQDVEDCAVLFFT